MKEPKGLAAALGPEYTPPMPRNPPGKRQFNVYLTPALIRRIKHEAVDAECSISRITEVALEAYLDRVEGERRNGAVAPAQAVAGK